MVKPPQPAPAGPVGKEFMERLGEGSLQLADVFRKANQDDYLYWDDFKYIPMPDGAGPEDAWRFVKLLRALDRHPTPIEDSRGAHYSYVLTEEIQRHLHNIDKWAGGWDTSARSGEGLPTDAARERFIISSLMDEAIASSQIEGAVTTRRKAREMLLRKIRPRTHGEGMVLNNYRTILKARELVGKPITPELIVSLQASMTEGTLQDPADVGHIRTDDSVVLMDQELRELYQPIPSAEIEGELRRLCDYANETSGVFVHPAIKAIALHFWLALIHPFADGNGRTARALFYLYMLKQGYWLFEYLSISQVIHRKRTQYERAYLYSEVDDADFTYFLVFSLKAIEEAVDKMRSDIARKMKEDRTLQGRLQTVAALNHRQRAILNRALKNADASFTYASHATANGVVLATARTDLLDLEQKGYLRRDRVGREYVFAPAPDLRDKIGDSR